MSDKRPSFQWYPKDFLTDENVEVMSLEEQGAYRRLMDYEWLHQGLPNDIPSLAKMCRVTPARFKKLWPKIEVCFKKNRDGTRLTHPRLKSERDKQDKWREKSRKGGRRSASVRADKSKGGSIGSQPKSNTSSSTASSSSTSVTTTTSDEGFDDFWKAYPKRSGDNPKGTARSRWRSNRKRGVAASGMIDGAKRYARWCDATEKTGTEIVKHAATFLGQQEGWDTAWTITESDHAKRDEADPGVEFNKRWAAHNEREPEDSAPVKAGGLVANILEHVQKGAA